MHRKVGCTRWRRSSAEPCVQVSNRLVLAGKVRSHLSCHELHLNVGESCLWWHITEHVKYLGVEEAGQGKKPTPMFLGSLMWVIFDKSGTQRSMALLEEWKAVQTTARDREGWPYLQARNAATRADRPCENTFLILQHVKIYSLHYITELRSLTWLVTTRTESIVASKR